MTTNTVLIVDDSATERTNLELIVRGAGCQVLTAESGRQALDLARERHPDLIFLDIVMDEMDGYQTCRTITGDERTRDIPVVIVSGKKQRADRLWAMEQGARDYITKPYTEEQIVERIRRF